MILEITLIFVMFSSKLLVKLLYPIDSRGQKVGVCVKKSVCSAILFISTLRKSGSLAGLTPIEHA